MNETDFIRQQLATEHAHLREILQAVRQRTAAPRRAVKRYIDWAGPRLLRQIGAHRTALAGAGGVDPEAAALLSRLSSAADQDAGSKAARPPDLEAERLLALLEAWSEPLEAMASKTLRIDHWRRAAQLSADSILAERQLYAAARAAAGLA
jgi:hypothetical protein